MARYFRQDRSNIFNTSISITKFASADEPKSSMDHIIEPTGIVEVASYPEIITHYEDKSNWHGYSDDYLRSLSNGHTDPDVPWAADYISTVNPEYKDHPHVKEGVDRALHLVRNAREDEGTLFHMRLPEHRVNYMAVDPNRKHHMATLLGLVNQHASGGQIIASSDLSKHSSRLANRLKEKGVGIKGSPNNPDMDTVNDIDWHDVEDMLGQQWFTSNDENWKQVEPSETRQAKESVKNILRASKPKKAEQPPKRDPREVPLPGFENE